MRLFSSRNQDAIGRFIRLQRVIENLIFDELSERNKQN